MPVDDRKNLAEQTRVSYHLLASVWMKSQFHQTMGRVKNGCLFSKLILDRHVVAALADVSPNRIAVTARGGSPIKVMHVETRLAPAQANTQ